MAIHVTTRLVLHCRYSLEVSLMVCKGQGTSFQIRVAFVLCHSLLCCFHICMKYNDFVITLLLNRFGFVNAWFTRTKPLNRFKPEVDNSACLMQNLDPVATRECSYSLFSFHSRMLVWQQLTSQKSRYS